MALRTTWFFLRGSTYYGPPYAAPGCRVSQPGSPQPLHAAAAEERSFGRPQGLGVGSEEFRRRWEPGVGSEAGRRRREPGVGSEAGRRPREPGVGSEGAAAVAAVPFGRRPRGLGVGSEARASWRRHFRSGRRPEAQMEAGEAWAWRRRHRRPGGSSPRCRPREGAAEVEASAWWSRPG